MSRVCRTQTAWSGTPGILGTRSRWNARAEELECAEVESSRVSANHRSKRDAGSGQDTGHDPEIHCCPSFPAKNVINYVWRAPARCSCRQSGAPLASSLSRRQYRTAPPRGVGVGALGYGFTYSRKATAEALIVTALCLTLAPARDLRSEYSVRH